MARVIWQCLFDGLLLSVVYNESSPLMFPYEVAHAASRALWLEGGSIAVSSGGVLLSPGAGLTPGAPFAGVGIDDALGEYRFLSIPYSGAGVELTANWSCYSGGVMAFTAFFPDGLANLARPAARLHGRHSGGSGVAPATHFPQFSAGAGTALRSADMGFVEWAGEMDEYGNTHGVGLEGYGGGRSSGPLLLFDRSAMAAGGAHRSMAP